MKQRRAALGDGGCAQKDRVTEERIETGCAKVPGLRSAQKDRVTEERIETVRRKHVVRVAGTQKDRVTEERIETSGGEVEGLGLGLKKTA